MGIALTLPAVSMFVLSEEEDRGAGRRRKVVRVWTTQKPDWMLRNTQGRRWGTKCHWEHHWYVLRIPRVLKWSFFSN